MGIGGRGRTSLISAYSGSFFLSDFLPKNWTFLILVSDLVEDLVSGSVEELGCGLLSVFEMMDEDGDVGGVSRTPAISLIKIFFFKKWISKPIVDEINKILVVIKTTRIVFFQSEKKI